MIWLGIVIMACINEYHNYKLNAYYKRTTAEYEKQISTYTTKK